MTRQSPLSSKGLTQPELAAGDPEMMDPVPAESPALRLVLLASLEDDVVGSTDAITRVLMEFEYCPSCTVSVALALLQLGHPLGLPDD